MQVASHDQRERERESKKERIIYKKLNYSALLLSTITFIIIFNNNTEAGMEFVCVLSSYTTYQFDFKNDLQSWT